MGEKGSYTDLIPENVKKINDYTFQLKQQLWFENLGENLSVIRDGLDVKDLPRFDGKPAVVIGAGASVWKYNHLKILKTSNFQGAIISTDRMFVNCLKQGVVPDLVVSVDGDKIISRFYEDPAIKKHADKVKACFAEIVHPETVRKCPLKIHWYISLLDDPVKDEKSLTRIIYWLTKGKTMLISTGQSGGDAWNIALTLGASPIILVGLDFGYPVGMPIEKTVYYKAYLDMCEGDKLKVKKCFRKIRNPQSGQEVLTDLNWDSYAHVFKQYAERTDVLTINCSPTSALWSQNIVYTPIEKALKQP